MRFPRRAGKGWEGRGDVLPLPVLIITQCVGVERAGGGGASSIVFGLLSWSS